jgi:hypothetical protein
MIADLSLWAILAATHLHDSSGHRFRDLPPEAAEAIATGCEDATWWRDSHVCVATLLVYAAAESALRPDVIGDHGAARGAWQSHTCGTKCASSWAAQVADILPTYRASLMTCGDLAQAASGSCRRATKLVRRRERDTKTLLTEMASEVGS